MPFELEKPTYCSKCDPNQERPNILSPQEQLIICFDYNYCPNCGRQLQFKSHVRYNPNKPKEE